jgi:hypothetical protein
MPGKNRVAETFVYLHRLRQLPRSQHCRIICLTKIERLRLTPEGVKRFGKNKKSGRHFAEKTSAKADQIVNGYLLVQLQPEVLPHDGQA